jgi:hypothetical protein
MFHNIDHFDLESNLFSRFYMKTKGHLLPFENKKYFIIAQEILRIRMRK